MSTILLESIIDIRPIINAKGCKQRIGEASIGIVRRNAELLNILVEPSYRHRGIGSRILSSAIDYLQDKNMVEFWANITGADDLDKAIKFYTKNGFSVYEEPSAYSTQVFAKQTLTKSTYAHFLSRHKVRRIREEDYFRL